MLTISKDEKGYKARFWYKDATGTPHQKRLSGFRTKAELKAAYSEFVTKAAQEVVPKKNTPKAFTMDELFEAFIGAKTDIKKQTVNTYINQYYAHLSPVFGGQTVLSIPKQEYTRFWTTAAKYSRSLLRIVYGFAEEHYDYPPFPRMPKIRKTQTVKRNDVWTEEQYKTFEKSLTIPYTKVLFNLMYYTGVRVGEALAVEWSDLDLTKKTLSISKTYSAAEKGKVGTPKTASSIRTILLTDETVERLAELKKESKTSFLFPGKDPNRPLGYNTIKESFYRAIEKSGVPQITLHGLRHSHASLLISKGASIALVSKRLGHSSVAMTLSVYTHMLPNDEQALIAVLNGTKNGTI